jgi:hypothetical protein
MTANGQSALDCVGCSFVIRLDVPDPPPAMFSLKCPKCAKLWLYSPRDIRPVAASDHPTPDK